MGLFKKFGAGAKRVVLGRKHGTCRVSMRIMPSRVAAEYGAAGAAVGAPKIIGYDAEVSTRTQALEHDDASVDRRGSERFGTRFSCTAAESRLRRLRC